MRTFLKVMGILLLIPLVVLFMGLVQTLAVAQAAHASLGSAAAVEKAFDEHVSAEDLESLAEGFGTLFEGDGGPDGEPGQIPVPTLPFDAEWFGGVAREAVLGGHAYFVGDADELPTLDLKPLLESLQEAVVEAALEQARPDSDLLLAAAAKALKKMPGSGLVDGVPTAKAVAVVKASAALADYPMTDEEAAAVALELLRKPGEGETATLTERVVRAYVVAKLALGEVSGAFSLQDFLVNLYGTDNNVVMVARDKGLDMAGLFVFAIAGLCLLLAAAIVLLSFSPKTTPLWLGIPLILSGVGLFLTSLMNRLLFRVIEQAMRSGGEGGPLGAGAVETFGTVDVTGPGAIGSGSEPLPIVGALSGFLEALTERMATALRIDALILVGAGVALIVLGVVLRIVLKRLFAPPAAAPAYAPGYTPGYAPPPPPRADHYWLFLAGRVAAFAAVVALGYVLVAGTVARVETDVQAIEDAVQEPVVDNPLVAIDATLGTSFAELMPQPSPSPGAP